MNTMIDTMIDTMTDTELSILNMSEVGLTHFITAAHQTLNAHLLGRNVEMLADAPAPNGTPDPSTVCNELDNMVKAPSTTEIAAVAKTLDTPMYQLLRAVRTVNSYISLLTAFCIYNEHPTPYDITKPEDAFAQTRAIAKWRNYVITGGAVKAIAAYIPVNSIVAHSYSKTVASADIHLEFLKEIFGGFSLPETALTELDSILTEVVKKLSNLKLSFETQSDCLDHFLTYYYFSTIPGTGGQGQPPAMYDAKIRTLYLHVDQSSWKASIGKSSANNISFHMNYYDMDTTMNPDLVARDAEAIQAALHKLTDLTDDELTKLMPIKGIHVDPKL